MSVDFKDLPVQTTDSVLTVDLIADLPLLDVEGAVLYVKQDQSLYLYNGTSWSVIAGSSAGTLTNWAFLAINWDTSPVVNASITGGVVWTYIYNSVTRYRFVPTTYDTSEDAFYTTFTDPTLSGLIVTRGF